MNCFYCKKDIALEPGLVEIAVMHENTCRTMGVGECTCKDVAHMLCARIELLKAGA